MLLPALIWLAAAAVNVEAEPTSLPVYEATFAPLERREREYAALGPVGPFYPTAAIKAGRNGEALLDCKVKDGGVLDGCRLLSEMPRDFNFGAAAQAMAQRRRISLPDAPAGERLRVHVPFTLGGPVQIKN